MVSFENTIFLLGGNDGKKKKNDMYSITVFDSKCYDLSSLPDNEDYKRNSFFDNVDSKLEFIDE